MKTTQNRPVQFYVFLGVGLLLFAIGCLAATFMIVKPLALVTSARSWVETPAKILDINLNSNSGGKGGTTYSIAIRYQYEFNGQTHTSERFSADIGSDNISSYHQDNYHRYYSFFGRNMPISCFVNPNDPSQAIIDRKPRFESLLFGNVFAYIFPLVGLFVFLHALTLLRRPAPDARQFYTNAKPLWFILVPTALTLAYTWFFFSSILPFAPFPWHLWLCLLPAFFLTLASLRRIFHAIAFRGTRLDLPRTALLGESLSASITLPGETESQIPVTLRCQRKKTTGSGDDNTVKTTTAWQATTPATTFFDGRNTTLSFRLNLPADQPATSLHATDNPSYTWQVLVKIKRLGFKRTLAIDFPVHGGVPPAEQLLTNDSGAADEVGSFRFLPRDANLPQPGDFATLAPLLKNKRIKLTVHSPSDFELTFKRASALFTAFIAVANFFIYISLILPLSEHLAKINVICIAPIFLGFPIALFGVPWLASKFIKFTRGGIRCDATTRVLHAWKKFGLLPRQTTAIPFKDIETFGLECAMTSSSDRWYRVHLQTTAKQRHSLTPMIKHKHPARALAEFLAASTR